MQLVDYQKIVNDRSARAKLISDCGSIENALESGKLPKYSDITLSEAIVLGLLRQEVKSYISVFGHGSTEVGEVLRVYEQEGLIKTYCVKNEIEASHAATALRWVTGEKAAVITSIGPGAMQALAASLVPISDGIGVWYLFGDETTENEGYNMQQIPRDEQYLFLKMASNVGNSYSLYTPGAVTSALRKGLNTVDHPHRAGAFFMLMPMNTQCEMIESFNLDELPVGNPPALGTSTDNNRFEKAVELIQNSSKILLRVGGGARKAGREIEKTLDLVDGVAITSPLVSGVIPYNHPRNLTIAGSKGSLCGNYSMDNADLLISLGSRSVCQSDSSRTAYPNVKNIININADIDSATHYNKTVAIVGDVTETLKKLNALLEDKKLNKGAVKSEWFTACSNKKAEWISFKAERYYTPCLFDKIWKKDVMTQPAALEIATKWARNNDSVSFFDAGDVQANGFQAVEDDKLGRTFTDTGASYMGFSTSALLATAISSKPFYGLAFTGDGSFVMNPQVLIDGTQHGAKGCVILMDNRRMGAISSLQHAQFGEENDYATNDSVEVDYVAWANAIKGVKGIFGGYTPEEFKKALNDAKTHDGISLIHLPVYFGLNPLGGLGVFGRWNVGNWCDDVQKMRHKIGL
ncbi:MAG TPA: thiamine pyrophosphate-dependent enzyme [Victivallales bacterium]|nr:thiamine pyrophosphate-dependent enzyme [Victivallales bacterium]